jgi:photosystem II stability/assembly factor-like uncharacterized protein
MRTKSLNILFIIYGLLVPANINCQWYKSELNGDLKKIAFFSQDTVAVIGTLGEIYLTVDNGVNWDDISLPVDDFITDAQFISDSQIYVTTTENFWMSDNFGENWHFKDYFDGLSGLKFFNDSIGIISSAHDIYQVNLNVGEIDTVWSMKDQEFFTYGAIHSMIFSNDSLGFAIGTIAKRISNPDLSDLFGIIIKTKNSGKDWSTIFYSDSILFMNNADIIVNNNQVYAIEDLTLFYTNINSDDPTWNTIEIPYSLADIGSLSKSSITSVFFTSIDTGYITISPTVLLDQTEGNGYDMILKTFNGGKTWFHQLIDTFDLVTTYANPSLSSILFLNDSNGMACGYNKIFKTINSGGGIISGWKEIKEYNSIKMFQNKDQLKINIDHIPNKLDIYFCDLNGRVIKRINETTTFSTNYIVDLRSFQEGIYIVSVIVDGKSKYTDVLCVMQRN